MTWQRTKRKKPETKTQPWPNLTPKQALWLKIKMSRKSPARSGTLKRLQRLMKKAAARVDEKLK